MKTFKTRHQFYLPDDLSERLELLAGKPDTSKTAILTDALRAWLDRAGDKPDQRISARLDRQQRAAERNAFRVEAIAETLNLFVQFQLTMVAHQPPFDQVTRQLGDRRYRQFMDLVAQRLAGTQAARAMNDANAQKGERL